MSATRPEVVDKYGVEHRYGCPEPGWISDPYPVVGWYIVRCSECGAVRLVSAGAR